MPVSPEHTRREALKTYAKTMLDPNMTHVDEAKNTRCGQLVYIVQRAIELNIGSENRTTDTMEDLKLVLIGEGLLGGRGKGTHFVGNFRGATGFKSELQDPYNQVQHAMAGLYIGYSYVLPLRWGVLWLEEEEQDDLLYKATFKIGKDLKDSNLSELPQKLSAAIGDSSCKTKWFY